MKVLFIGNSATYVNNVPQTLVALANAQGYELASAQLTPGGFDLVRHADSSTEHGKAVLAEIEKGYDVVFLQENGKWIITEDRRQAGREACRTLGAAVKNSGAKLYYYVRPPYGKMLGEYDSLEQCRLFDEHFVASAQETGAQCVFVNRAFAYAIRHASFPLWGEDNAHTSIYGAYLIVCTFFATLFGTSATQLGTGELSAEDARSLAEIADKIALEGVIPW